MNTYPLAQHFLAVADKIKELGKSLNLSNDELLDLYSLFKQGNFGDNTTEQPSFYQLEAKAKWGAWNKQKGKSQDQARQEYVELALRHFPENLKAQYSQ